MSQQTPGFVDDDEVVESIRTINKQRKSRLIMVIVGMIGALIVGSLMIYLAYSDESEAVKSIQTE